MDIPDGEVIIASGPLTSDALAENILRRTAAKGRTSMTPSRRSYRWIPSIWKARSAPPGMIRGTADYVNCPMTEEEYTAFWKELTTAREAAVHGFDDGGVFEGCMPVEVMARRGFDTLRYGPMKPVGLRDPHTGHEPYAVVQLRQDNADGTLYNLVGFRRIWRFRRRGGFFSMILAREAGLLRRDAPEYLFAVARKARPVLPADR